jgi:hypothetical protein
VPEWILVPEKERAGDADGNGGRCLVAYLKIVSSLRISFSSPCIHSLVLSSRVLLFPGLVLGGNKTKVYLSKYIYYTLPKVYTRD